MPAPAKMLVGAAVLGVTAVAVAAKMRQAAEEEEVQQEAARRQAAMEEAALRAAKHREKQQLEEEEQRRRYRQRGGRAAPSPRPRAADAGDIVYPALDLRNKLLAESLLRLKARCEADRRRDAHRQRQDLLRIPILGAPEPVEAVVLAALLLWGNLQDFRRHFDGPRICEGLGLLVPGEPDSLFDFDAVHR